MALPGLVAKTIDFGLLDGELGLSGVLGEGVAPLLDGVFRAELLGVDFRDAQFEGRNQTVLEELFVHLGAKLGRLVVGLDAGGQGFLLENGAFDRDALADELGLGGLELRVGVGHSAFDVRVGENENDAVRRDDGTGAEDDFVHAALRAGGEPGDVLGRERAETADLAEHLAALHFARPDEILVHGRDGGLEPREEDRDCNQRHGAAGDEHDAFLALGFGLIGTLDIHGRAGNCTRRASHGKHLQHIV